MTRLLLSRLLICTTVSLLLCADLPTAFAQRDEPVKESRSGPRGSAQLTLKEAIRLGLDRHPSLEQSRYASQAARAITKQIQGDQYPWIKASVAGTSGSLRIVTSDGRTIHDRGGHGFDPGGALPHHNQNMLTGGLLVNQLITDFGYTAHRVLAGRATEAASEKASLTKKALVILTVQKAYLNCLLQEQLVHVTEETLKRRRAVRDQVESLYRHQLKSKVDLDLIRVETSNAELALIRAQNDFKSNVAALNNAMGVQGPEAYDLQAVEFSVSSSLPDIDTLVTDGLQNRPELLGGRDKIEASDELLKAVKALNFGSVSAVGSLGVTKYWDAHDSGIRDNEVAPFWGLGATARLPLFTGFKIRNQISEASHLRGEAEYDLQDIANEVVLQIIRAYLTQTTNAEQIALEQQRVEYAKEALALAQERYRIGLSPIIDVIRATAVAFEAESGLAEAQYIYKTSEAVVAYATGQDYKRY
jgi:outer membrane protein